MKIHRALGIPVLVATSLCLPAFAAHSIDSTTIGKLNRYVRECNAPGAEPKPKMKELETYLRGHGFSEVTIECGISNYETPPAPTLLLDFPDGGRIYVNYRKASGKAKVHEVIEDSKSATGRHRQVIWPAPKSAEKNRSKRK